jgi:hypothetical protein
VGDLTTFPDLRQLKLEPARRVATLPAMKFVLSIATYLALGLLLAAGILVAVKGSFWLLIAGFVLYLGLLIKFGCQTH